jgi:hypothetical protein
MRELMKAVTSKIWSILANVHTHMPAQVVSYNATENTCSVQPTIQRIRTSDPDKVLVNLPQLDDVPVKQFGSGKCLLSIAPQEGSYGLLHISERAISNWLLAGGVVGPLSTRKFDLSDAIFDPGVYPLVEDGDNGKLQTAVATDRIELRTRTRDAFVAVVDDDTVEINADTDFAVQYTALKDAFDELKSDFNSLVTDYNAHIHVTTATVSTGSPGVIAPTTTTGTPTTADMSGSKIESIKVP